MRQQGQVVLAHRTALAGLADPGQDLGPTERFSGTGPLDDSQDGRLDRREAPAALGALPPAPDRGAVVGSSRVDDPGVVMSAERAVHAGLQLVRDGPLSRAGWQGPGPVLGVNFGRNWGRNWGQPEDGPGGNYHAPVDHQPQP